MRRTAIPPIIPPTIAPTGWLSLVELLSAVVGVGVGGIVEIEVAEDRVKVVKEAVEVKAGTKMGSAFTVSGIWTLLAQMPEPY
jgi:hypothetical protein